MPFPQIRSIDELLKLEQPGLACDLDETCCGTVSYWVQELQKQFGNPENLSAEEMIQKYQYVQNVPYWRGPNVDAKITELVGSNKLQKELPLVSGADITLRKIHEIVPINCYLTIRPESIVEGTREWLVKHNFPDAFIFARPEYIRRDDGNQWAEEILKKAYQWKVEVLRKSYPKLLGIIDDNQKLALELGVDYPGKIFLFGHETSPNGCRNVIPCQDWGEVYRKVKARYS